MHLDNRVASCVSPLLSPAQVSASIEGSDELIIPLNMRPLQNTVIFAWPAPYSDGGDERSADGTSIQRE